MVPVYEYRTTRHRVAELPEPIRHPSDGVAGLRALLDGRETEALGRETEALVVLVLNTKNRPIASEVVYVGNVAGSPVRVGEVFRLAVRMNGTAILVGHNHPSGDTEPSLADLQLTEELMKAGKLLDIEVLDHIIVGEDRWISLRERGALAL